jgi:hypothetical protein
MDPELFKQKLEQFAELKQLKVARSAGRAEATEPEVIERGGESFTIELDDNPTIGWGIKKLKPRIEVCSDCNKTVTNRVIQHKLYFIPEKHWRENCQNCQKIKDPFTNEFTVTTARSYAIYSAFLEGKERPQEYKKQDDKLQPILRPVCKKPTK